MRMRPSRVLKKLRAGETVCCFKQNLESARVTELAALSGFDCVWTDMEHTSCNLETVEKQVMAGKAHDVDVLVRVSRGSYSDYIRPLELDASGIMVPHIMNLQDAREVVRMTRFYPLGLRPVDGGNADGSYCLIDFNEYIQQANAQRFVIVQIEDPEPLKDLDAIAALPGIDMLFFGPGDFSHAIGAPAQFDHPRLLEARRLVAEACAAHGKFAGTVAGPQNMAELMEMGYQFLGIGADVVGLSRYCADLLKSFQDLTNENRVIESSAPAQSTYRTAS